MGRWITVSGHHVFIEDAAAPTTKQGAGAQFAESFNSHVNLLRADAKGKARTIAETAKAKYKELRERDKAAGGKAKYKELRERDKAAGGKASKEEHAKQAAELAVAPHSAGWDRETHDDLVSAVANEGLAGNFAVTGAFVKENAYRLHREGGAIHAINPLDPLEHETLAASKAGMEGTGDWKDTTPVGRAYREELARVPGPYREYVDEKAADAKEKGRVGPARFK